MRRRRENFVQNGSNQLNNDAMKFLRLIQVSWRLTLSSILFVIAFILLISEADTLVYFLIVKVVAIGLGCVGYWLYKVAEKRNEIDKFKELFEQ